MSRLTIDLTDEQHRDLKAVAALQGKTIKQFAVERLFATEGAISDEDKAWEEFKTLIGKRVDSALADPSSWSTFDEAWPLDDNLDKAA
jgi:Antitoxin ParD